MALNYGPNQSQCRVRLPFSNLVNGQWRLRDRLGTSGDERDGHELQFRRFYLDVAPWQCHVFSVTKIA